MNSPENLLQPVDAVAKFIFSVMCVCSGGGPHHTGPVLGPGPWTSPRHVQTCSGWIALYMDPSPPYVACTVGKAGGWHFTNLYFQPADEIVGR